MHSVTFSRDNLLQLVLRPDFYEKMPELEFLRAELTTCVQKFRESGQKAGCGCRADVSLLYDCMEHLLTTVEGWRESDPPLVCKFVEYATKLSPTQNDKILLSVFFRRAGVDDDAHKYEFVCQQ